MKKIMLLIAALLVVPTGAIIAHADSVDDPQDQRSAEVVYYEKVYDHISHSIDTVQTEQTMINKSVDNDKASLSQNPVKNWSNPAVPTTRATMEKNYQHDKRAQIKVNDHLNRLNNELSATRIALQQAQQKTARHAVDKSIWHLAQLVVKLVIL